MEPESSFLPDDLPPWELVFRFTPGRLCLSFCATVGERWRRNFERLRSPADLARWMREAGLTSVEVSVTDQALREARLLREAIYRSVRAGMDGALPADADREVLNGWARRPDVAPQLTKDGARETWAGPHPARSCLSAVARDAVELIAGPDLGRVRECAAPDCALLFFDRSRPGHRRWCAGSACGAKSRSASYRRRHRSRPQAGSKAAAQ